MATLSQALADPTRMVYEPPTDPLALALANGRPVTDRSRLAAASQQNQSAYNAMANYQPYDEPQTLTQGPQPPSAGADILQTIPSTIAKLPYYVAGGVADALGYGMEIADTTRSFLTGDPMKSPEELAAANPMRDLTSSALQGDYEQATGTDYYEPQTLPGMGTEFGLTLAMPGPGGEVKAGRALIKGSKAARAAELAAAAKAVRDAAATEPTPTPKKTITVKGEQRYVGAPPGVNTPEAEEALIKSLMDKAKEGRQGAGFYTDFQNEIRRSTQDPLQARRFTSASGTTSQDVTPASNTTWSLKAMNQQTVGAPFRTGRYPNANRAKLEEQMPTGDLPAEDPKSGQYGINLLPKEFRPPEGPFIARSGFKTYDRPVHDQWDFDAFGYAKTAQGGANHARHEYMDRIYGDVIARLNAEEGGNFWNNETTQAAIWRKQRSTGKKAASEGSISEMMNERKGQSQFGIVPGRSTGVDAKLIDAPLATLEKYVAHMVKAITDKGGGSRIARAFGFSTPMRKGYGPWQGNMEPNVVVDYAMGSEGGAAAKVTDPASEEAAKAMRQAHQLGFGQEAAGFTTPYGPGTTKATGDLAQVEGFSLKTQDDYDRAYKLAEQTFGPDWAKRVVIMPSIDGGNSLIIKNISGFLPAKKRRMTNPDFLKQSGSFGKVSPGRDLSGQFDDLKWNTPEYRQLLETFEKNPALKAIFDEKILPEFARIQKQSESWAKETGIPADTVPDRLRIILTTAGENWPQAVADAVKKGTIPAIAGVIALNALRDANDRAADEEAVASGGGA